ncbi:aminotransferase DegT [Candidatus Gottesmanbacteria bacterium RBG_16_38_7b]|uniref:Aminotransferase DegT n=1 Tax=Candidatus Gottesmanbacteria bacterium RBG_16_38_7b TaxID=1798372 RepID=A0A1F5YLH3_9BACT|nr:MAG: aminotransferase DegT [Candidatus Gottesmanbacteria bacterium RBG_16_38_7b]
MKKFIPIAYPDLTGNENIYLNRVLKSSWISSQGEYLIKFEQKFAEFIGCRYAVTTSNGTTALHLALTALGIGKGDEVIVPDLTFIASVNAITYCGARPVLCDVNRQSWQLDPKEIIKRINSRTKAIMAVHLYGIPANLDQIMDIANKYNLQVIEDAAEAHGALVKIKSLWKKVGSVGHVGCFSFYGNKIITTGEGGMVTTDAKQLAMRMRVLRDHGQKPGRRYYHPFIGFNYRLTNLQAAIGLAQLEKIHSFLKFKSRLASLYNRYLENTPGIIIPKTDYEAKPVCWLYSVIIDDPYPLTRDEVMEKLKNKGIETRPFFFPVNLLPPYKSSQKFPNSNYLFQHGLNLPSGYNLTPGEITFICQQIRDEIKN